MKQERYFIREMSLEDIDKVVPMAATDLYNPWTKAMFRGEWLIPSSYRFLIGSSTRGEEERILGYICFRVYEEESELLNIGVAPEHRQRGLGKRLMAFYLDFCQRKGVKKFYLEVHPENLPALRLYRGFQYRVTGSRKKFYQKADALVLER